MVALRPPPPAVELTVVPVKTAAPTALLHAQGSARVAGRLSLMEIRWTVVAAVVALAVAQAVAERAVALVVQAVVEVLPLAVERRARQQHRVPPPAHAARLNCRPL